MDYQAINNDFLTVEENIKIRTNNMNRQNPLDSVIPTVVNNIHSLTKKYFPEAYLLSIALLIDDIFKITFPEGEDAVSWNTYSFYKKGSIGRHCEKALSSKTKVFAYQNKIDIISQQNLTQRDAFLAGEIHSFFVSPLIVHNKVIGSIQLSFNCDIDNATRSIIEEYLLWLNNKIIWIIYSEFTRINSILDNTYSLLNALENIDEYQAYHSFCVSKLAKVFGYVLNTKQEYRSLLYKDDKSEEINLLKLQLAGLLHDIGKIKMWSFEKFNSEIEECKRKLHSYFSYTILNKVAFSEEIALIAGHHHERWDGKGIPFGIEQESMSIESQIIKFADAVDSCLRERPKSYFDLANSELNNNDIRKPFSDALEMFRDENFQNGFSKNIYSILLAILYDINDNNIDERFDVIFNDIRELLGMNKFQKSIINIPDEFVLHNILNPYFNNLDLNKWIVLFVFNCKNIEKLIIENSNLFYIDGTYSLSETSETKNYLFQFINLSDDFYIGVHVEEREKEFTYSFCEYLDILLGIENNVVCSFLTYNIIHNPNFESILKECIKTLKIVCSQMSNNSRWRLLKFDINNNQWK